jgi:L-amino acid N-acyltransferase YncA
VTAAAGPAGPILVRDAAPGDWPAIWPFMREIVMAGETFSWDTGTSEHDARAGWFRDGQAGGFTVVATGDGGTVLGTAECGPNHGGPGSHVATASFMVDPRHAGRGVGRALGEYVLDRAHAEGFRAMQFNAVAESNVRAVRLWQSLGMQILATIPEGFRHPADGYVGLHIMYQRLTSA